MIHSSVILRSAQCKHHAKAILGLESQESLRLPLAFQNSNVASTPLCDPLANKLLVHLRTDLKYHQKTTFTNVNASCSEYISLLLVVANYAPNFISKANIEAQILMQTTHHSRTTRSARILRSKTNLRIRSVERLVR